LASRASVAMENVGFMGDDVVDLHAMQRVGFAVTVPNAPPYVALGAHWTTIKQGGYGAVRECCDLILAAQGKLGQLLQPGRLPTGQTIQ